MKKKIKEPAKGHDIPPKTDEEGPVGAALKDAALFTKKTVFTTAVEGGGQEGIISKLLK